VNPQPRTPRGRDELPDAAERAAVGQKLRNLGLSAAAVSDLVRAGESRRQIAGRLKTWLQARPKRT
jgi:hypothetical protein